MKFIGNWWGLSLSYGEASLEHDSARACPVPERFLQDFLGQHFAQCLLRDLAMLCTKILSPAQEQVLTWNVSRPDKNGKVVTNTDTAI